MAQLSDDCFAFGGPMMSALRRGRRPDHGARQRDRTIWKRWRWSRRMGACWRAMSPRLCRCRRSPTPRLTGYAVRNADLPDSHGAGVAARWPHPGRRPRTGVPIKPAPLAARIFTMRADAAPVPKPSSCRRTFASTMNGKIVLPPVG